MPIVGALREAAAAAAGRSSAVRGYRETRSVGMLVLDDDERPRGCARRRSARSGSRRLGVYEREARDVAAARHRACASASGRGCSRRFRRWKPFVPSDAAVYLSRLRPGGAQYEVLESVAAGR